MVGKRTKVDYDMSVDKSKQLGQYFTPDFVADFMIALSSKQKGDTVLEPSSGKGVFLAELKQAGYSNITAFEVDTSLLAKSDACVRNESFVTAVINQKFDLIIGNPPYVRWKNLIESQREELINSDLWRTNFNSLSDFLYFFILRAVNLLKDNGELIFITPEYWLNTMHADTLRNYLLKNGYIESIYHFSETPIFSKVASSFVIFKFIKKSGPKPRVKINKYLSNKKLGSQDLIDIPTNKNWLQFETDQFRPYESWVLAPELIQQELRDYEYKCTIGRREVNSQLFDDDVSYIRLGDISVIANGLVSGLDKAFQIPANSKLTNKEQRAVMSVIKAKDIKSLKSEHTRNYIFLNNTSTTETELKQDYPHFYSQLKPLQDQLEKRYSYNRQIPYWEWVFLRSFKLFSQPVKKIFVPCKERITNKSRLRFSLAKEDNFPTQDVTAIYLKPSVRESLSYVLALLNSSLTYDWVKYKGLLKGGIAEFSERPLGSIPIRLIDWENPHDVTLHNKITALVDDYIENPSSTVTIDQIDSLVFELLK